MVAVLVLVRVMYLCFRWGVLVWVLVDQVAAPPGPVLLEPAAAVVVVVAAAVVAGG